MEAKDGHLLEDLGSFGLGPLDQWADRTMADTTSLWVVEQLEFYRNTNNTAYLHANFPTVANAVKWMVANANTNGQGLPYRLVCTYDIIDFSQYDTTTFNSFIYLAAMRAAEEMAVVVGDTATRDTALRAFVTGQAQVLRLLWNSSLGYFRAYTGHDALMGDCLYGQMLALHHGLGWLIAPQYIQAHLAAELKFNGDAYGIKVVTGRHNPPPVRLSRADAPRLASLSRRLAQGVDRMYELNERSGFDTQDDVIWLGAAPDWSYLQVVLSSNGTVLPPAQLAAALAPTQAQLVNYRDRLRDLWNIVGITSPADWGTDEALHGMPYVTSHYGFVMTDYYLLPGLSGQATDIPNGSLTFTPVFPCPFTVPLLLAGTTGTVSCQGGTYTVTIAFGSLTLPAGGLVVNGRPYAKAVALGPGASVTW